jgi:hypothetical protein
VVAIFNSFLGTVAVDIMPLPSTPLFIAGGIARMKPYYTIPAFVVGKVVSDTAAVLMGKYAAENTGDLLHGVMSWKSFAGLLLALLLIFSILFIDWRTLIQQKKLKLKLISGNNYFQFRCRKFSSTNYQQKAFVEITKTF